MSGNTAAPPAVAMRYPGEAFSINPKPEVVYSPLSSTCGPGNTLLTLSEGVHCPRMPRSVPPQAWQEFLRLLSRGESINASAKLAGISPSTARAYVAQMNAQDTTAGKLDKEITSFGQSRAIPYRQLTKDARKAHDDIAFFAKRYFGFVLLPWHIEAVRRITELYESSNREYVVINCPPGAGKTTFFAKVVPLWLTVRDRGIRGLLGSSTFSKGVKLTDSLRREFTRKHPILVESGSLKGGYAVNASGVLAKDFGAFKPLAGKEVWRREEFIVIQQNEVDISEKEPTWQAFGYGSDLIGNRVDFMIWDDLYEERKMKSPESRDELKAWWDSTIESRLEPGGLLLLEGQRLHSDDIYAYALGKSRPQDSADDAPPQDFSIESMSVEEIAQLSYERQRMTATKPAVAKYNHIKFKAHYDDHCKHWETHKPDAPPYPDGCLLYPKRLGWTDLAQKMAEDPRVWETVYQQEDMDPQERIFNPIWLDGGMGTDGIDYIGCYDEGRSFGEIPEDLVPPVYSVVTVDPSPANYWSIQWWLVQPETEQRWLIDLYNNRFKPEDFLRYNLNTRAFFGLMQDWQQRSILANHPITHWIIEHNAAQKWLLAHDFALTWQRLNDTQIVGHYTTVNKVDPEYGVAGILPNVYRQGKCRFPGKERFHMKRFRDEIVKYPNGSTNDNVMSQWFLEWNMRFLYTPEIQIVRKKKLKWHYKKAV